MKIGIDNIAFYIPSKYIELSELAIARGIDPDKFTKGLLIEQMSIATFAEDIIAMAANAASRVINKENIEDIDLVLFATESSIDYSKAAATYIAGLLNLRKNIRAVEIKQACYSGTAALYFAKGHILQNPQSKVLVITADIAKYGINNSAEPTQGAGAVAMIVSKDPHILEIENNYSVQTEHVYDFWRPKGHTYARVDGHFSDQTYQKFFLNIFEQHQQKYQTILDDFSALLFHVPYAKIAYRSLKMVTNEQSHKALFEALDAATKYNKKVGNIYTGSLYLSLISLLENGALIAGKRIGLFSYGSGAVGEFFSGILQVGYEQYLHHVYHQSLFDDRTELDIKTYETYAVASLDFNENQSFMIPESKGFYLEKIENDMRVYKINH